MNNSEIDITSLLETDMFEFSHSQAEGGENAGPNTWNAAMNGPRPLLTTPEQFDEFRDYVRGFGAWTDEEIEAWNENECQALLLQMIAGDTREAPALIDGVSIYLRNGGWFYDHESTPDLETGAFDTRSETYQAAASEHYRPNCYPHAESIDEIDWEEYEVMSQAGRIAGRLFKTDEGRVYFSIGN